MHTQRFTMETLQCIGAGGKILGSGKRFVDA